MTDNVRRTMHSSYVISSVSRSSKCTKIAARASPHTPLGELTAFPQIPQLGLVGPISKALREGRKWVERRQER